MARRGKKNSHKNWPHSFLFIFVLSWPETKQRVVPEAVTSLVNIMTTSEQRNRREEN